MSTKCRNCQKELCRRNKDAGSIIEETRLCDHCRDQTTVCIDRIFMIIFFITFMYLANNIIQSLIKFYNGN